MYITDAIQYIGVNDHKIELFEGQYKVPNGMAYNSYMILDEKIAIMDTVDTNFTEEWLFNIERELCGKQPDFLIIQHMEPDHSANITKFMERYQQTRIVASAKAFDIMNQFFGTNYADRKLVIKDGDILELGEHTLSFLAAPMVHWPEVMVTYDRKDKVLFSADAFGKFGALDVEEEWTSEARRYYFGIVGKYGAQVQALLKKAAALEVNKICPLHGPVLHETIDKVMELYDIWSSYRAQSEGVMIAYTSVYGNTKAAVELLAEKLRQKNVKVFVTDLAREDMSKAVADAFYYDRLVLATTTYNGDIFPFMKEFIHHLTERNYQNRKIAFMENGSWAATGAKVMAKMLEGSKNLTTAETVVTIKSALNEESMAQIDCLVNEWLNN